MTKKILIILSILAPFITFYLIKFAFKLSEKKLPFLPLALISLILLILFRAYTILPFLSCRHNQILNCQNLYHG